MARVYPVSQTGNAMPSSRPDRTVTRLPAYDYRQPGAYFVTICTREKRPHFGRVAGDRVQLSAAGRIAWACWQSIPDRFPHAIPDAFVAMPDHVHGILVITEMPQTRRDTACRVLHSDRAPSSVDTPGHPYSDRAPSSADTAGHPYSDRAPSSVDTAGHLHSDRAPSSADTADHPYSDRAPSSVDTACRVPTEGDGSESFARPIAGSLSTIVRSYKSAVTRLARAGGHADFGWQGRFYERIVRSRRELANVRRYIDENPSRWRG